MIYGSDEGRWYTAVMGVSGIHYKPTKSLFQPHYTKQRNSKYSLQKSINVKISAPHITAEPAVKVFT
jgi:hypothetical protein